MNKPTPITLADVEGLLISPYPLMPIDIRVDNADDCPILTFDARAIGGTAVAVKLVPDAAESIGILLTASAAANRVGRVQREEHAATDVAADKLAEAAAGGDDD